MVRLVEAQIKLCGYFMSLEIGGKNDLEMFVPPLKVSYVLSSQSAASSVTLLILTLFRTSKRPVHLACPCCLDQ